MRESASLLMSWTRERFFSEFFDLVGGEQYSGGAGNSGEGGAQVVGHRTQDVAPDGLPVGLQLDGVFLLVEAGIELVERFGVLFPLDGLNGLELYSGGEGAHHRGDGHHAHHGHRVARVAQGEDPVGEHEVVVDTKYRPPERRQCRMRSRRSGRRYRPPPDTKNQSGVIFRAGMAQQDAADHIGDAQKQKSDQQIPGN
mgnify:CR=1 FL=1